MASGGMSIGENRAAYALINAVFFCGNFGLKHFISGAGGVIAVGAFLACFVAFARQFAEPFLLFAHVAAALFIGFGLAGGQNIGGFGNDFHGQRHHLFHNRGNAAAKQERQSQQCKFTHHNPVPNPARL